MAKGKNRNNRGKKDPLFIECPQCGGGVVITAVKCGIFRHGTYKDSGKQINPHTSKERCEELVSQGLIDGCGKPFQISKEDHSVSICDYI